MLNKELLRLWNKFETTGTVNDYLEFVRASNEDNTDDKLLFGDNIISSELRESINDD